MVSLATQLCDVRAELASVFREDAERSFSGRGNVLTDQRQALTKGNRAQSLPYANSKIRTLHSEPLQIPISIC